ncbi:MAG: tRNA (N6-isopentenyl adenosine(37)-C2)-methylthiotransferase MiaB [Gemmataceae bacterium]
MQTDTVKTLYLETVGCQMNVLDSELVVGSLRRAGYQLVHDPAGADLLLFNTCSVREHAEEKIYSALGRVRKQKVERPGTVVGVLGCMAQKDQDIIFKRAPYVDIVCGPGQLAKLPEMINQVIAGEGRQTAYSLGRADASKLQITESFESYDALREPSMRPTAFQAFVRTQFGCDKFCTYCIVPSVRGPEQGRPPAHVLAEIRQLADQGCKEITLVGQTVNSYRYIDGGTTYRLSDLLALIHDTAGIERIKFVTNFPKDMTDDLLQSVRDLPKVCKYLHVPAQHGDDEVLRRMKRLYTVAFYREMLARAREVIPGVAVSSDFIVGFCGETEAAFERTRELVREAQFKNSFIFKYSPRPGTKADELFPDDVPEEVKKRRNNDLLLDQSACSLAEGRRWIGQTVDVLVEGPAKRGDYALTGRTMTDHIVVFDGPTRLVGNTVPVLVSEASPFTLYGDVVTEEFVGAAQECCETIADPRPRIALPIL